MAASLSRIELTAAPRSGSQTDPSGLSPTVRSSSTAGSHAEETSPPPNFPTSRRHAHPSTAAGNLFELRRVQCLNPRRGVHVTALLSILLLVQAQATAATPELPLPNATTVQATRTATAPVLDGKDDDAVWQSSPAIGQFLEAKPAEGSQPKLRTEARVAYDEHNLYAFIRAFDPHPDSIVSLLARRDDQPASDYVTIMLDPYHDRRTGYEFTVNPAGVKADYAIFNDGDEDVAWDAVWDAATRIDSLGWTAEYRIPLSQLHYSAKDGGTFGILFWRVIQRHTATVTWPLYRMSRSGLPSQFGTLTGLEGLGSPGRAELVPYVVTKNVQDGGAPSFDRTQDVSIGGDFRYRLASNLLLNATVNPDFGQVEADPSELNLSAFETFFTEQRPFFVEGKGLFTFTVNCVVVVDCNTGEGLFYSRRIGRSPQLADVAGVCGLGGRDQDPGRGQGHRPDAARPLDRRCSMR